MILKKPTFLIVVLSLVMALAFAVPQSALATPGACPDSTYSMVAYYNWDPDNGDFDLALDRPHLVDIEFTDLVIQLEKGEWDVISGHWHVVGETMRIDAVVITDGHSAPIPHQYIYDPPGPYEDDFYKADLGAGISNIVFCVLTTPVTMSSFAASANRGTVSIAWTTATEINTAGFILYRSTTVDGVRTKVSNLISAQGSELTGASYRASDSPGYGTFYYWLENVDYSGQSGSHGPVVVKVLPAIRLPVIRPSLPGQ